MIKAYGRRSGLVALFHHPLQPLIHIIPVDYVPEGIHELGPLVLIIHVVGVLPDVQDYDDLEGRVDVNVVLLYLHDDGPPGLLAEAQCRPS